jgi:transglutaminase-like putative cysteine protease
VSRAGTTVAEVEGFEPLGEDELRRYRERAQAAAEKHPGVESVLCLDYGQDTLTPEGQHTWRYHALVLVLTEEGREAADIQLGFTEGRSRRRVLFARSISPVGKSLWLDPATLKISTPAQEQRHLDTRRRVLSGRVPGVQVGSLVEYAHEYVLYNPDVPDYFFPGYYFQGETPYLDSIIDVRVPAGRSLNWTTKHVPEGAREPTRSTRGEYDVYRWAMHDQPPLVPEPSMPDKTDVVPQVHGSLFQDWDDLHQRTGGYQTERIEVTPEIQKLAEQIVGDATTADAKLARIYHWVQRKINYMSIKASRASGWAGHHATETLENGYGDCTDKAIVFASLAKAAGIRSYPVILKTNTEGAAVTDIPMPDANHCINVAYPDGKRRFLDATAENYRYPYFRADDHGVKAVIHIPGEITDIPVPPPDHNLRQSRQTLTLQPDGSAVCVERNAYTGPYEARVRGFWRSVPPTLHPRMMQQYLQRRCPGALCTDFELSDLDDLSEQLTMGIDYKVPGLATKTRDLYIVSPPGFDRQFPEAALQERTYAIEHQTSAGYETTVEVTPPEG